MKFKVGDRVEVVEENPYHPVGAVGNCGRVRMVDESDGMCYSVDFSDGRYLWMCEDWLKLKEDKMDLNAKLDEAKKLWKEVEAEMAKEKLDFGNFQLRNNGDHIALLYDGTKACSCIITIDKDGKFRRTGFVNESIPLKLDSEGRIVEG
jgi:hypothetical protein